MKQIKLSDQVSLSNIVHGIWRLTEWHMSNQEIIKLVEDCLAMGIDTFDHADLYGDYMCEELLEMQSQRGHI